MAESVKAPGCEQHYVLSLGQRVRAPARSRSLIFFYVHDEIHVITLCYKVENSKRVCVSACVCARVCVRVNARVCVRLCARVCV